jgi:hypothetical protein
LGALILEPVLELWCAGDEEAVEQIAPIELERVGVPSRFERQVERTYVGPAALFTQADLIVATILDCPATE